MADLDAVTALAAYLGVSAGDPRLAGILDAAQALITAEWPTLDAPDAVRTLVTHEVAGNLWRRRDQASPASVPGFDGATPVRATRDALATVRPLIAPYMAPPIG